MNTLTIKDIVAATGGTLLCGDLHNSVTAICTDTRKITPGALFVPIVGETFDAHDFINLALESGCVASLTAKHEIVEGKTLIAVNDTRKALGALAAFYRKQFNIPFIAVTGSVGKTTVKELTATVLSTHLNVLKTSGNFNNDIGLPLTLFRLENNHETAITEMGMSGFGEIDYLAAMVKPDIGIVTNIGLSHIEKLGSQENIYKAKAELFPHIKLEGTVIINGDDPILAAHLQDINRKTITVGLNTNCDLYAKDIKTTTESLSFTAMYGHQAVPVTLPLPGEHNAMNALLACATGLALGIPLEEAAQALKSYVATDKRMQIIHHNQLTIINDCYNAAPASVEAALKVLCARPGRKIAVLGDIKELGEHTESAHRTIGRQAMILGADALFAFGKNAAFAAQSAKEAGMNLVFSFTDMDELNQTLGAFVKANDSILIKGSRAMQLERVTDYLTKE